MTLRRFAKSPAIGHGDRPVVERVRAKPETLIADRLSFCYSRATGERDEDKDDG